jgi:signal transduction histidine kinase
MKKSIWIFLLAVLLPSAVLGWLALRSAEEQQIVFERRTAELYQKETETLAGTVREAVEAERRVFGETVHRLLANGDAEALARDFTNTLADAWPQKAIGFVLDKDGKLISPAVAGSTKNPEWSKFLRDNTSFLCSSEPALVYSVQNEGQFRGNYLGRDQFGSSKLKSSANVTQVKRTEELQAKELVKVESKGQVLADEQMNPRPIARLEAAAAGGKPMGDAAMPLAKGGAQVLQKPAQLAAASDKLAKDAEGGAKSFQAVAADPVPASTGVASTNGAAFARPPGAPRPSEPQLAVAPERAGAGRTLGPMTGNQMQATASTKASPATAPAKEATAPAASPAPPPTDAPGTFALQIAPAGQPMESADSRKDLRIRRAAEEDPNEAGRKNLAERDASKSVAPPSAPPAPEGAAVWKQDSAQKKRIDLQRLVEADGNIEQAGKIAVNRQVEPQQLLGSPSNAVSVVMPETAEFRALTEEADEGIVSRFVQDKLDLIFWLRPPEAPEMVFGCLVEAANLTELWKSVLERHLAASRRSYDGSDGQPGYLLALLDDKGRPAATRPASVFARDWKRPFVASEIGEALPHWEAALYLASPTALADTARGLWRTLAFTIAGAVALIALGGWLVVADARRQVALAQQKTDFVSNVSHELKTPLTSIRMFAELMQDRPLPPEKQGKYLRIITVEAERLTRLINNVLDFAKLGRKQKRFEKRPLDLHEVISRVWESQGLHLREAGFTTQWEAAPGPYPVLGDDDALAQVLVNLLSNAEKYSTERKEVEMHTWIDGGWVNVSVLDRGMGVPNGEERKIFESFYRAHDSLSSGIQGSGLGLTLAQHVAVEHGGEIQFERREGGGSRFTLRLPTQEKPPPTLS